MLTRRPVFNPDCPDPLSTIVYIVTQCSMSPSHSNFGVLSCTADFTVLFSVDIRVGNTMKPTIDIPSCNSSFLVVRLECPSTDPYF